jgi:putative hemolysin
MDGAVTPGDPFTLHIAPQPLLTRAAFAAARPFLSWLLRLPVYRELYRAVTNDCEGSFESRSLKALGIGLEARTANAIPPSGALIVVANHPTGALDGLVLIEAVRQVRADVRILTNHLLARIPQLRDSCFFVDPFAGPAAVMRSHAGLRAAHLWLRGGGALVMFPAGEVAWRNASPEKTPTDSPWSPSVGRLALATGAHVLPAFLAARNSRLFYAAGRIHPVLRTSLLARELLDHRGETVRVVLGDLLAPDALKPCGPQGATSQIRSAVDRLATAGKHVVQPVRGDVPQPVAAAVDARQLASDVTSLPADCLLLSSGDFDVFCADATQIPNVRAEIGRLREITFRQAGEGTGKEIDLDRYDDIYQHLFVWNRDRHEVVGAYRVGATDRIVPRHGADGLYTRSLFRYDERMLAKLSPALELGRSFVRQEYQKSYNALLLLWKGIGQLIARSPRYRVLFGPVSISSRYRDTSQQLLRAFLAQQHGDDAFDGLVEPLNPPPSMAPPLRGTAAVADVDELDKLIARLEGGQGIPVLLRQYLKLDATLLGFNVDPAFGDALDALMMVDLNRVERSTLRRYLGRRESEAFLAYHETRRHAA